MKLQAAGENSSRQEENNENDFVPSSSHDKMRAAKVIPGAKGLLLGFHQAEATWYAEELEALVHLEELETHIHNVINTLSTTS